MFSLHKTLGGFQEHSVFMLQPKDFMLVFGKSDETDRTLQTLLHPPSRVLVMLSRIISQNPSVIKTGLNEGESLQPLQIITVFFTNSKLKYIINIILVTLPQKKISEVQK